MTKFYVYEKGSDEVVVFETLEAAGTYITSHIAELGDEEYTPDLFSLVEGIALTFMVDTAPRITFGEPTKKTRKKRGPNKAKAGNSDLLNAADIEPVVVKKRGRKPGSKIVNGKTVTPANGAVHSADAAY